MVEEKIRESRKKKRESRFTIALPYMTRGKMALQPKKGVVRNWGKSKNENKLTQTVIC